jgi:hypothetical protein
MQTRFTTQLRQEIVEDYCRRNGGTFDAPGFYAENKSKNARAYAWFEHDLTKAAYEHNLALARKFAHGLKVFFTVEEIGRSGPIKVNVSAPLVISPMAGRKGGGGYQRTDPEDLTELCHEASAALQSWLNRYGACLSVIGLQQKTFAQAVRDLEAVEPATV